MIFDATSQINFFLFCMKRSREESEKQSPKPEKELNQDDDKEPKRKDTKVNSPQFVNFFRKKKK